MDREKLIADLLVALNLEACSFAHYVLDISIPRIEDHRGSEVIDLLHRVADDEDRIVSRIAKLLDEMGVFPDVGTYEFYTSLYNYVKADYLLGVVGDRLAQHLSRLEALVPEVEGEAAAESIIQDAIRLKKNHIQRVSQMMEQLRADEATVETDSPTPETN